MAIHCCPASPPPRSSVIAGSATLTTVASTATTAEPMIDATSAPRFASIAEHATCRSVRAMLAYVFWHVAAAGTGREDYEARLAGFHAALRDDPSPGLGADRHVRAGRASRGSDGRGGYEDWYLVDGLRRAGRAQRGGGVGRPPRPARRRGRPRRRPASPGSWATSPARCCPRRRRWAAWLAKPAGTTYAAWHAALATPPDPSAAVWQRQMTLGPGPGVLRARRGAVALDGRPTPGTCAPSSPPSRTDG